MDRLALSRRAFVGASALLAGMAGMPRAFAQTALSSSQATKVQNLVAAMTPDEKFGQMTQLAGGRQKNLNSRIDAAALDRVRAGGVGSYLHVAGAEPLRELQRVAVEESRLKIPLLFAMDVVHGYRTIFPVPLAMASSWNPQVLKEAASIAAREAAVSGLHWTFAPMVDIARDPRWGRVVEGAGEDPYLGARLAVAQVEGFEGGDAANGRTLMSCVKHFGAYGAAMGGRDYDSADISQRSLHEIYLPPFHAAVAAQAGSFMTAFNDIGGVPTTGNPDLVRRLLREEWGYQGLIVSDWNAVKELIAHGAARTPAEAAALALRASVDMDMTSETYAQHLGEAVASDPSLMPLVDEAVTRILSAKMRLGLFDDPFRYGDVAAERAVVGSAEHRAAARQAADQSIVLLRNEGNLLPLKRQAKIAIVGALADDAQSAVASWRARGQPEEAVTLRAAMPQATYAPGVTGRDADVSGIPAAVAAAQEADVVVLAIGEDYDFSAEARSRSDITLPGPQMQLVEAIKATGKPIVAVLMNGRPMALGSALEGIPAVLETWFLGLDSGPAIADVLTGKVNPAGRLPMQMPRVTGAVPSTYAHLPTGRPANPDLAVDSARYTDTPITPLFPFGHGLSYSTFAYSDIRIEPASGGGVEVSVTVANTGSRDGEEVVQLYIRAPVAGLARPVKELRGFSKVPIAAGKQRRLTFRLMPEHAAVWFPEGWKLMPGEIDVMVGASADDIRQRGSFTQTASRPVQGLAGAALECEVRVT